METTRLIRLSKVIVGMLLLIFSAYLIFIPWTYLIPISSNFWSGCIKFWWIYIGFLKEYVMRGSYWLTCQSFVFKDKVSVGFGNCCKVVPQSTGHLNGARKCGAMKMEKSFQECMVAKWRRSGSESHMLKTPCQQELFAVESPFKCTIPLVICI